MAVNHEDDGELLHSLEDEDYSFALEYTGPPPPFIVPKAQAISYPSSSSTTLASSLLPRNRSPLPQVALNSSVEFSNNLHHSVLSPVLGLIDRCHSIPQSPSPAAHASTVCTGIDSMDAGASSSCTGIDSVDAYASSNLADVHSMQAHTSCEETHIGSTQSRACLSVTEIEPVDTPTSPAGADIDFTGKSLNTGEFSFNSSSSSSMISEESECFFLPISNIDTLVYKENIHNPPCKTKATRAEAGEPLKHSPNVSSNIVLQMPVLSSPSGNFFHKVWRAQCSHCSRSCRFQNKESCLVCLASFCHGCVLFGMGSMPEGRKCLGCIGLSIDESKRPSLGKPSRLIKRMLCPLEVQQIMKAERECPANQLQPEQVIVNGQQLKANELASLLSCDNPPLKLNPGSYWYDKQSGFWGKEGKRPDEVITADLNIGGMLLFSASHGNTGVYMNEREVTAMELKLLKFAGVQCPPGTQLWVYSDGSYQEQGQKNMKGNIWRKAPSRFLYPFFRMPMPYKQRRRHNINCSSVTALCNHLQRRNNYKVLLLGHEGSGTSTIFKQAKYLFRKDGFTEKELEDMKLMIQKNIYKYIGILLQGREHFEEEKLAGLLHQDTLAQKCKLSAEMKQGTQEAPQNMSTKAQKEGPLTPTSDGLFDIGGSEGTEPSMKENLYSMDSRLRNDADWLLKVVVNGNLDDFFPTATKEYASVVANMWSDSAIQATFSRKAELHMLPDVAKFFLDKVIEVSMDEYEPNERDILYAEGLSQGFGLSEFEFSFDDKILGVEPDEEGHNDAPSAAIRYQLIRIAANGLEDRCKWLEMFEGVRIVVFCVAINEYDQMWIDSNGQLRNKMVLSRELFKSILRHPCFQDTPFLLLLNKYDLLEEKIGTVPLTACEWFSDFDPFRAAHYSSQVLAQQAYTYVAHKFKKLFASFSTPRRKLYTSPLKARDRAFVSAAFQNVHEILKWEDAKSLTCWHHPEETSSYTGDL